MQYLYLMILMVPSHFISFLVGTFNMFYAIFSGPSFFHAQLFFLFQFHSVCWLYQTDPNWSNFLYDEATKTINLIDFGAARDYPKHFVDNYLRMVIFLLWVQLWFLFFFYFTPVFLAHGFLMGLWTLNLPNYVYFKYEINIWFLNLLFDILSEFSWVIGSLLHICELGVQFYLWIVKGFTMIWWVAGCRKVVKCWSFPLEDI